MFVQKKRDRERNRKTEISIALHNSTQLSFAWFRIVCNVPVGGRSRLYISTLKLIRVSASKN